MRLLLGCNCCALQARRQCISRRLPRPHSRKPSNRAWSGSRRKNLRCYLPDNLPFAYFNGKGDLVGLDIEMAFGAGPRCATRLCSAMRDRMTEQVNEGYCDIVMSGTVITPERALAVAFSAPYMDVTLAFVVKDHRLEEFSSREALRRLKAPRLGVLNLPYYIDKVHSSPQATIVPLNSITEFFEGKGEELDAFLFSAEVGLPGVCSTRPIRSHPPARGAEGPRGLPTAAW